MAGETMFENAAPAPRFGVSLRGYDRAQVDGYVADNARWAALAWGRIRDLEARLSELKGSEAPQSVRGRTDQVIEEARRTVDQFVEQVDTKVAELEDAVRTATRPQLDELRDRVSHLEDERRAALDRLTRLRESLGSLHGDPGTANGDDGGSANGAEVRDHVGRPAQASAVDPVFSRQ